MPLKSGLPSGVRRILGACAGVRRAPVSMAAVTKSRVRMILSWLLLIRFGEFVFGAGGEDLAAVREGHASAGAVIRSVLGLEAVDGDGHAFLDDFAIDAAAHELAGGSAGEG